MRENPVTGKVEMYYPFKKTIKKIVCVSVPVTVLCLRYLTLVHGSSEKIGKVIGG